FIDTEGLDLIGIAPEDLHDLRRHLDVSRHSRTNVDTFRTELPCAANRERGMYAKLARFVRTCGNDAATLSDFRIRTDDDRPAPVLRMVKLLNGRVESIHVDVKDSAHSKVRSVET